MTRLCHPATGTQVANHPLFLDLLPRRLFPIAEALAGQGTVRRCLCPVFPLPSELRHRLFPVSPLPSQLRQRLSLRSSLAGMAGG